MEKGTLKIKESGKHQLKVGKNEAPPPKEFDFSALAIGNYECDVDKPTGTVVRIVVNGKDIPKKDLEVQRKAEQAQKREQEEIAQKERDKQEREQRKQQPIQNNQNQVNMALPDSFNRDKMRVPKDVRNLTALNGIDNFALKLYKGARYESGTDKFYFFNSKAITKKIDGVNTTLVTAFDIQHKNYGLNENKIPEIAAQHKKSAEQLFNTEGCLKHQNFTPDWRVVVGLGTDSVYETGITLHHIYGFPYIPASAIKGITNHYVLDLIKEAKENKDEPLIKSLEELYLKIFGSTKQAGKMTFFDAMPTSIPQLKPDIMNVHYPKYYGSGNEAPTDTQSPIPILFLTVEKTAFQFMIGCKEANKDLLQTAFTWLESALKDKGIGAKTAVGYGYMKS